MRGPNVVMPNFTPVNFRLTKYTEQGLVAESPQDCILCLTAPYSFHRTDHKPRRGDTVGFADGKAREHLAET